MSSSKPRVVVVLLFLPFLLELLALAIIPSVTVPRSISRPLVIAALVLAGAEILRAIEESVRLAREWNAEESEISVSDRFWETWGDRFCSLGPAGMALYLLTCAACIVGFGMSFAVQTAEDAARMGFLTQSESTLLAAVSFAALLLSVRIAFVQRSGWPLN